MVEKTDFCLPPLRYTLLKELKGTHREGKGEQWRLLTWVGRACPATWGGASTGPDAQVLPSQSGRQPETASADPPSPTASASGPLASTHLLATLGPAPDSQAAPHLRTSVCALPTGQPHVTSPDHSA